MPFRIRTTDTAKAELRKLPGHVRQNARQIIERLRDDPTPSRAKELRGLPGRYRLRLLTWRIIYRFESESVLILAIRQKTGPETYEDIEE